MISQLLERVRVNCMFGEKLCEICLVEESVAVYQRDKDPDGFDRGDGKSDR